MPVVTAVLGDITTENVDAVVNATDETMRGGGGVNGAIHRSGGPAILRDCVARFPNGLATGDAGWTTAGDLPARWVIHAVGPDYTAGQRDRSLLVSCYTRALAIAAELGARSVAFPLIGAGGFGWPRADAVAAAIETIAAARVPVEEVRLVSVDEAAHRQIRAVLWIHCPPPVAPGSVGSLFERLPKQFGLRGDPYLWRELRARFAGTALPDDWFTLRRLLTAAIEDVVGRPPTGPGATRWPDDTAAVHVPEFNPGHGMSAGLVDLRWWTHTAVPILLDRYAALREPGPLRDD